jgi:hypothetical protein
MTTFNVDSLDFVDDEEARFGTDTDFATRFDSTNTRLELADLTNATVGYVPQNVGTDLVGGKFAQTVAEGKALADDGNVYDSIQTAQDNASSWVKVGEGQFRENVTIDTNGLTLVGSGERTEIVSTPVVVDVASGASDVTLSSFKVVHQITSTQGASVEINGSGATVEDIIVENAHRYGFRSNSAETIFSNCKVVGEAKSAALAFGIVNGPRSMVVNSRAKNMALDQGIFVGAHDCIVSSNTFENLTYGPNSAIIKIAGHDTVCYANTIRDVESVGINTNGYNDNIVVNNVLVNTGGTNGSGTGNIVRDNQVI